jgi:copper chaperone NosL
MNRTALLILIIAASFVFSAVALTQTGSDVDLHKSCKYCGMDRSQFNFTRMLIEFDDGSVAAFCSIHCAAVDLAVHIDKTPKAIWVGDFNDRRLIDAEKAFWVIGGLKPGVMSKRGKWAFENKDQSEQFLKTNQGRPASFDEAMKAAFEDMAEDTKMIRERRKMKRMKMPESKARPGL